jgi:uncharacterized protein (TIGR03118 family)
MNRTRSLVLIAASVALIAAGISSSQASSARYKVENLVSDGYISTPHVDANLVNGWGIAFNPFGFVWVADNGKGVSTLYDGLGVPQPLVVTIPTARGVPPPGLPTGIVYNGSGDFAVTKEGVSGPSRFLFATQDGVIAGWAPTVDGTHALQGALTPKAVYMGLALASNGKGNFLYATDFLNGRIHVFDKVFAPVTMPGGFVDDSIPPGFSPFNIQNIQGDLYVTYAKHEPGEGDEIAGPGLGFVNVFDANGHLLRRVATRGRLNAPWGLALAPASFGKFANRLLVGNFGDGTINAYDAHSGAFKGQLRGTNGKPLKVDGLWGIAFGNGIQNQPTGTLFFAAGPVEEEHGLYGTITPVPGGDDDDDRDD